mgnify:CR=1 FL=1
MDIGNLLLTALPYVLGIAVVWARASRVLNALKELADVLTAINNAFTDKALSVEEVAAIKKEIAEALTAFKAILTK